jgi:hypothetical protein
MRGVRTAFQMAVWLTASLGAEPVISEFMADNESGLRDEDGDRSDWIEIHNPGSAEVDLAGWRLTDDESRPGRWTFPTVVLAPEARVVVFASGKSRAVAGSELHTNFALARSGEYLALVRPDLTVAQAFAPAFPEMDPDRSFGPVDGGNGFLSLPPRGCRTPRPPEWGS